MPQNYSKELKEDPEFPSGLGPNIRISEYTYQLPDEKIALFPLEERDQSKLLVFDQGKLSDRRFSDLPGLLRKGDLLVFNRSRVIHARLNFQTSNGSNIEVFCINQDDTMSEGLEVGSGTTVWLCMVGRASKWKQEEMLSLTLEGGQLTLKAQKVGRSEDLFRIKFIWNAPEMEFIRVLEHFGKLPIPPYLNRAPEATDSLRYQTVYAKDSGSVAAPTAGLHFTPELINQLIGNEINISYITLHVGTGTFRPVKAENLGGHQMHREEYNIPLETFESMAACQGRIIAVGTTALRAIESACISFERRKSINDLITDQWEGLESQQGGLHLKPAKQVFLEIAEQMRQESLSFLQGYTSLLICPPYQIRTIQALITNFHQPESTLLLLVAAALGKKWKDVYQYAIENEYRFLSYGDASLLIL